MNCPQNLSSAPPAGREYDDLLKSSEELSQAAVRGDMQAAQTALSRRQTIMRAIESRLTSGPAAGSDSAGILAKILDLDRQVVEVWERRAAVITSELEKLGNGRRAGRAYRMAAGMERQGARFFDDSH
jgi:hypothetical protein